MYILKLIFKILILVGGFCTYQTTGLQLLDFKNSIINKIPSGEISTLLQRWDYKSSIVNRSYMICPYARCPDDADKQSLTITRDECCLCRAQPEWKVPAETTQPVFVEYIRRRGIAWLYVKDNSQTLYFKLQHNYGFLSEIPVNICDFPNLVEINLANNNIFLIGNISCLSILDTLELSYNRIKVIKNDTFVGLSRLRILRVTHNGLTTLEPSTITRKSLQIFIVDFSHNNMENIEFSNLVSENDFCDFDFSRNKIKELVNNNHFKIDLEKTYKGGMVHLGGNNFTKFIDFGKIGITDLRVLGKVISYGFDLTDTKWDCDCSMEPFLELAEDVVHKIWRDYFNTSCYNPPEYRGWSIPHMIMDHLDLLICNLTEKEKCPPKCYCFYQPKERKTVVNCTGAELTELPRHLPEYSNITLILKNNSIKHFTNREYLTNVSVMDLSGNAINKICPKTINSLPKNISMNLVGNKLSSVPRILQTLNPCLQNFGELVIHCGCESAWIPDWINNRHAKYCSNVSQYKCKTDNGLIPVEQLSMNDFCKLEKSYVAEIVLSTITLVLVVVCSLSYLYRYEIYLFQRKYLKRYQKLSSKINCVPKYDAFLSFNDENPILRMWVFDEFVRDLEVSGYKLFVPCRDLPLGSVKEERLVESILNSKHYIILLCDYYKNGGMPWTEIEWKYIWHKFKDHLQRNIIVVNFDQVEANDNVDPRLRAFLRLDYDIDFSNRKHDLIKKVKQQLGSPLKARLFDHNKKTKFWCQNLTFYKYLPKNTIRANDTKAKFYPGVYLQPGKGSQEFILRRYDTNSDQFSLYSQDENFEPLSSSNINISC